MCKSRYEELQEILAPTRCCGCDCYGALMCASCQQRIQSYDRSQSCLNCGAAFGRIACTECFDTRFEFDQVLILGNFESVIRRAILLWKDRNEQRLGALFGNMLGQAIRLEWGDWADQLVYVPSTKASLKRRGFSQSRQLVAAVSTAVGLTPADIFVKDVNQDLRGLAKSQRLKLMSKGFHLSEKAEVKSRVLIIDDVLTTGSTLNSLSLLAKKAGAQEVRVAVIARTVKS